jgi:hypothetical protein
LKNTLHNKIYPAAVIALLGAAISLLACTIVGARGVVKGFLPLWLFLFFGLLNIVLGKVPHTARWKWFKPAVFAAAAVVILLLLALFT